jgi:hypothetical protein
MALCLAYQPGTHFSLKRAHKEDLSELPLHFRLLATSVHAVRLAYLIFDGQQSRVCRLLSARPFL